MEQKHGRSGDAKEEAAEERPEEEEEEKAGLSGRVM